MLEAVPDAIHQSVSSLWLVPSPGPENLFSHPAFKALQNACETAYPEQGSGTALTFALHNALCSVGMPFRLPAGRVHLAPSAADAAIILDSALRRRHGTRVHLSPLDLADELPELTFGDATVRRFSAGELASLLKLERLERTYPKLEVDVKRLSEFHWLCVKEAITLDTEPGQRATPFLYQDLREDRGRIEPHRSKLPSAVERSLFFLLLAPWEDWSELTSVDWRAFHIPWTYTVTEDIFTHLVTPPSPDSLTWETQIATSADGEEIEYERPTYLPLSDAANTAPDMLNDTSWTALQSALQSPLFETPVAHFLVRAFAAEDIDEFLAHITVIEAALGLREDYGGSSSKTKAVSKLSATKKVAARVAGLLGDAAHGEVYQNLFHLRSAFLHGRSMGAISTEDQLQARRLARLVVNGLVRLALSHPGTHTRQMLLEELLHRGLAGPKTLF
jgi:hypothetical protein